MITANRNYIPRAIYRHGMTSPGTLLQDYMTINDNSEVEIELDRLYTLEHLRNLQFKLRGFKTSLMTQNTHFVYLGTYYLIGHGGGINLYLMDNGCIRIENDNNASIYPATPRKSFAGTDMAVSPGTGSDTLRSYSPTRRERIGPVLLEADASGWRLGNFDNGNPPETYISIGYDLSFQLVNAAHQQWRDKSFVNVINSLLTSFFNVIPCMVIVTGGEAELVLL